MNDLRDFFISYTSADEAWARWIAWVLHENEYTFYIQALDFVPGRNFIAEMRKAIVNSRQTIAVLSPQYLDSRYASAEVNAALVVDPVGTAGKLVPVRVALCEPRELLAGCIYIDLVGKDDHAARHELLAGIAASRLGYRAASADVRFEKAPRFPGSKTVITELVPAATAPLPPPQISVLYFGVETGSGLDLAGQATGIASALSGSANAARFNFVSSLDVNTENIFSILNTHRPHIVHFSGKQNGGNVLIQTPSGGVTTISDLALAGLLQNIGDTVKLAIIDTCESLRCAQSIVGTVDLALGVAGAVEDSDAILYYNIFYAALAAGRSVAAASAQARAALEFRRVPEDEIPQLVLRQGVDPTSYMFV